MHKCKLFEIISFCLKSKGKKKKKKAKSYLQYTKVLQKNLHFIKNKVISKMILIFWKKISVFIDMFIVTNKLINLYYANNFLRDEPFLLKNTNSLNINISYLKLCLKYKIFIYFIFKYIKKINNKFI